MSKFETKYLVDVFSALGNQLKSPDESLSALIQDEHFYNAWFTPENVDLAVRSIGEMLNSTSLHAWLAKYPGENSKQSKKVGLILAGNIPLVGFHDVLSVLVSGNHALIKASSQDGRLIKEVLRRLLLIEPAFADQFTFVERLEGFDAVIATGSNNSSRYFDYYFSKVPHIIRRNRNSLAVLTGNESNEQLFQLGKDIFNFFGLGCRNVSKIYVPAGYRMATFFEAIEPYHTIIDHHKYNNNYDYNKSIYLVNRNDHLDNGFLLVKEDTGLISPLAVLFYEYYDSLTSLNDSLSKLSDQIQCIVGNAALQVSSQLVDFGQSQHPALWDYADGVDTMDFLTKL